MRQDELRHFYNLRPVLTEETSWVRIQLRITFRLIQLHYARNPLMVEAPNHYLSQLSHSFMYLPNCGMLAFWLVALRGRPAEETVSSALFRMYHAAEDGVTFRAVAFPAYKRSRNFVPGSRRNRQ